MLQTDLFNQTRPETLYKTGGPSTSRDAASELAETGKLGAMELKALNLVTVYPGSTAAELEKRAGLERGQISKRLSTLFNQGRVVRLEKRRCNITNRSAFTYTTRINKPR